MSSMVGKGEEKRADKSKKGKTIMETLKEKEDRKLRKKSSN